MTEEAPRPFVKGDTIIDQEGERSTFLRYSSTGYWGFFRYSGISQEQKLPIAGLRKAPR